MTKGDYRQLLKPDIINRVSGLELIVKVIVDNYLSGLNHSRRVGAGMEFSQYRGYEPGDDLRLLDWKMLARSGRYYIKQSDIETNVSVKFILDSSNSMTYSEAGICKMDYVKVLVATLAYLANNQGDSIGLFALNENNLFKLQPRLQKQFYKRFLQELINIKNEGKWPENPVSLEKMHDNSKKELIFFISDLYEYNSEISSMIKALKSPRNEVVFIHVMGHDELKFNYNGTLIFEDIETGKRIKVNSKSSRKEYLKAMQSYLEGIKKDFLANGISYQLFKMNDDMADTLQLFLKNRKNLI